MLLQFNIENQLMAEAAEKQNLAAGKASRVGLLTNEGARSGIFTLTRTFVVPSQTKRSKSSITNASSHCPRGTHLGMSSRNGSSERSCRN